MIVPKFFVGEGVVVFAVFVLSSCSVQKFLIDRYYLVGHYYCIIFSWGFIILLFVLIEVIIIFRIVWLTFCELFP